MFRIDRTFVNLTGEQVVQTITDNKQHIENTAEDDGIRLAIESQLKRCEEMAGEIINDARAEAEKLLGKAEIDAADIKTAARESGYTEGRLRAEQEYEALCKRDADMLSRLITEIERARDEMFGELEDEILELCLSIVRKILDLDGDRGGEIFEAVIKNALGRMDLEGKVIIRVSAAEYERFFSSGSADFVLGDSSVTATIVEEPAMSGGDCVIETDSETINASLDQQLRYIELAFRHRRGND